MDFPTKSINHKGEEEPSSRHTGTDKATFLKEPRSHGKLANQGSYLASFHEDEEERNASSQQYFKPTSQLEESLCLSLQNGLHLIEKTEDPKKVGEKKSRGDEKTSFTATANTCHEKKYPYSYSAGFGSNMEIICWQEEQQSDLVAVQQSIDRSFNKHGAHFKNILHRSCNGNKYISPIQNPGCSPRQASKSNTNSSCLMQSCGIGSAVRHDGQALTPVSVTEISAMRQPVFVLDERRAKTPLIFKADGTPNLSAVSTGGSSKKTPLLATRSNRMPSYSKKRSSTATVCPVAVSITEGAVCMTEGATRSPGASMDEGAVAFAAASERSQNFSGQLKGVRSKRVGSFLQTNHIPQQKNPLNTKMQQRLEFPCQWEKCAESAYSVTALFHHIMQVGLSA